MSNFLILFLLIYLLAIIFYLIKHHYKLSETDSKSFLFSGGKVGVFLSFMSISATLFSAFQMQGMPAFFRNHGIGAWIFSSIGILSIAAVMMPFGLMLRRVARKVADQVVNYASGYKDKTPINNITSLLFRSKLPKSFIFMYLVMISIFLLPYITIQIKGAAMLFSASLPFNFSPQMNYFIWSVIIITVMYLYSYFGGLKAIYVTDAIQGAIFLFVIWIIVFMVIDSAGGITALFNDVKAVNPKLLSIPGPNNLFTVSYLIVSFFSVMCMPYTQPQITTRILVIKDDKAFIKSCAALAVFALLIVSAPMFIGMRGVIYPDDINSGGFIMQILQNDTATWVHALFIVALLAASMSTTDSLIFAAGTEWSSFLTKIMEQDKEKNLHNSHYNIKSSDNTDTSGKQTIIYVKIFSAIVALISLVLAQLSFPSLILFAMKSITGTSFMLPILISAAVDNKFRKYMLAYMSLIIIFIYLLVITNIIPNTVMLLGYSLPIELVFYGIIFSYIIYIFFLTPKYNVEYYTKVQL